MKPLTHHLSLSILCSIVLMIGSLQSLAQQDSVRYDSLVNQLDQTLSPKERMETLILLSEMLKRDNSHQASQYAKEALNIADEISDSRGKSDAYYLVGAVYFETSEYDTLFVFLDSALSNAKKIDYQKGIANALNAKAAVYEKIDEYELALELHQQALEIREVLQDTSGIVDSYGNLSFLYLKLGDTQKALEFARKSLMLRSDYFYIGRLGDVFVEMGRLDSALLYYQGSLDAANQAKAQRGVALAKFGIARTYEAKGSFVEALSWYNEALIQFLALDDKSNASTCYMNIGLTHAYMGNLAEAIDYTQQALAINLTIGAKSGASTNYNNIGYLHFMQDNYSLAQVYLDSALMMAKQSQNLDNFATVYGSYTELYLALGDYDKVINYHQRAISLFEEMGKPINVAVNLNNISSYYLVLKQYQNALRTSTKALTMAKELGTNVIARDAAKYQAKAYAGLGKGMEAYQAHVYHKTMADSIVNAEKTREFTQLEAEYEFKQEKDSIAFAQEKETLALNVTIAQGKSRQQTTLFGLTAVGLLLIILSAFYFKNQKKNRLLAKLNSDVQVQNTEIKAQRDHLDDLNKTKSKFFSIISHDLRSPMSSFQALSDVIDFNLKEENYEELREVNQEVVKRSKEISLLLDNLLAWAVSEEGEFPFNPEQTSIKDAVEQVKELYAPVALYKNISIVDETQDDQVYTDTNAFKTIVRNLVSNSIKFTDAGGKIILKSEEVEDMIQLEITDNGAGMTAEEVEMLNAGSITSKSGTSGEKGVGLGMKLVKEFIDLSGGQLTINSKKGQGTQFMILLPKSVSEVVNA